MKQIIYSYYKVGKKEKRGTFEDGVFYRDRVPTIWDKFIALELDVIEQLEKLGCIHLDFDLRNGMKIRTTIERFKGSPIKEMGKPDRRKQYLFEISQASVKPKDDPRQGDMFR